MRLTIFAGARGSAADPRTARVVEYPSASAVLDALVSVESRPCPDQSSKLDSPAYALAVWRPDASRRDWDSLAPDSETEVLAYDLDEMSADELAPAIAAWRASGHDIGLHTTWKHTPESPRLRLLVAITPALPAADRAQYKGAYHAVAHALGLKHDIATSAPNSLFFLRQHRPPTEPGPVLRWRGRPIDWTLLPAPPASAGSDGADAIGATGARPDRGELRALVTKWRRRSASEHLRACANALASVIRAERYAEDGHVYTVTQHLALALARELPDLDADWFAETWLEPVWRQMWPGEALDPIWRDWRNAWRSALDRHAESRAQYAEDRAALAGTAARPTLDGDEDAAARAAAHGGALICIRGSAYYVFDPRTGTYSHPVRAGGLAARARDLLSGLPSFSAVEPRDNGRPAPKGATQLVVDYGTAIDDVHYYAHPPTGLAFDREHKRIKVAAYQWNDFAAVHHPIADELFRAMAGDRYPALEAWLSKVRKLERPLPALVLVGAPGTWKSRTAQHLSRFWGDPDAPGACRASQVLGRFSGPLLSNPVVWSDESLATDERGRAQPERYRESISEIAHQVERKGLEPVILHSALRHVIAVNDIDLVFSREISGDAVRATMDRYLVVHIDADAVAAFETRWAGTPEIQRLRYGATMLEHVRWIETERAVPDQGRFGVATDTDPDDLARAKFRNDELNLILQVATDAVVDEAARSVPGQLERCPIAVVDGELRLRPRVISDLWPAARATRGQRGSQPTIERIGRVLDAAGFRAGGGGPGGFRLDADMWVRWMRISEIYDPAAVLRALARASNRS